MDDYTGWNWNNYNSYHYGRGSGFSMDYNGNGYGIDLSASHSRLFSGDGINYLFKTEALEEIIDNQMFFYR